MFDWQAKETNDRNFKWVDILPILRHRFVTHYCIKSNKSNFIFTANIKHGAKIKIQRCESVSHFNQSRNAPSIIKTSDDACAFTLHKPKAFLVLWPHVRRFIIILYGFYSQQSEICRIINYSLFATLILIPSNRDLVDII